jgi:type 1 glutamine amidotransferase
VRLLAPVAAVLLCGWLAACGGPDPAASGPAAGSAPYRVLVFTRTTGFRHASIPTGIATIRALGADHGFAVTATEDPAAFTPSGLAGYRAVVFLSTSGDVLDPAGRTALQAYVRGGGGFVGIHSAADTEYGWPFYGELVGARFAGHPAVQPLTVRFRPGPLTAGLPASWRVTDEPYNFRSHPEGVQVLATLDESTYSGGTMGADHPVAWTSEVGRGRSFYTGLGHPDPIYADPVFRRLLAAGIRYATG